MSTFGDFLPVEELIANVRLAPATSRSPELGSLARYERPGRGSWWPARLKVTADRQWPYPVIAPVDVRLARRPQIRVRPKLSCHCACMRVVTSGMLPNDQNVSVSGHPPVTRVPLFRMSGSVAAAAFTRVVRRSPPGRLQQCGGEKQCRNVAKEVPHCTGCP